MSMRAKKTRVQSNSISFMNGQGRVQEGIRSVLVRDQCLDMRTAWISGIYKPSSPSNYSLQLVSPYSVTKTILTSPFHTRFTKWRKLQHLHTPCHWQPPFPKRSLQQPIVCKWDNFWNPSPHILHLSQQQRCCPAYHQPISRRRSPEWHLLPGTSRSSGRRG